MKRHQMSAVAVLLRALLCASASSLAATFIAHAADAPPVVAPGSAVGAFPPNPAPTSAPTLSPPPPPPPSSAPAPAAIPVPAPAPAVSAVPGPATIKAEGNERFTLNFRNMPIEQVFELLSRTDKVNIIVSKGVTGTVSVNLYRVTLKEAIQNSSERGVQNFDAALINLYKQGRIAMEEALVNADSRANMQAKISFG